ncbi:polysaccharide biosynthesis C-terminal domain-containing protein [Bacteroides thetaiotaomicron]|nr:polysaccharide biosynthesis C-terminal domain-containing protein [Bacteroides thetaiotaomicron]
MMCIVVVLYAKPIVLLVLGSTWVEMVEPFKIIFVSYVFQTLLFSFNPLLRAYGFTKQEFRFYTIKMLVMIGLLYPLTYWYGLIGAGISILLAVICVFPYLFYTIKKLTHVELRQIFYSFGISLFVSFITVGVFMYIPDFDGFWWVLEMFIAITFASFFYFLLALILKKGPGLAILSLTHLKK